jgi:hypothetical protein
MYSRNSFSARRAFLNLSVDEYERISAPIHTFYMRILYFSATLMALGISIASFLYFNPTDMFKGVLQSAQIGISSSMVLACLFMFLGGSRCIADRVNKVTYHQFCELMSYFSPP